MAEANAVSSPTATSRRSPSRRDCSVSTTAAESGVRSTAAASLRSHRMACVTNTAENSAVQRPDALLKSFRVLDSALCMADGRHAANRTVQIYARRQKHGKVADVSITAARRRAPYRAASCRDKACRTFVTATRVDSAKNLAAGMRRVDIDPPAVYVPFTGQPLPSNSSVPSRNAEGQLCETTLSAASTNARVKQSPAHDGHVRRHPCALDTVAVFAASMKTASMPLRLLATSFASDMGAVHDVSLAVAKLRHVAVISATASHTEGANGAKSRSVQTALATLEERRRRVSVMAEVTDVKDVGSLEAATVPSSSAATVASARFVTRRSRRWSSC